MKQEQLPSWWELSKKDDEGTDLDPLEAFILNQEPAGADEEAEFRGQLAAALSHVTGAVFVP